MGAHDDSAGLPAWARGPVGAAPSPAGGPLAAGGGTVPAGPGAPRRGKERLAGLTWLYRYLVVGTLALAGASALRLLDRWDEGAYWGLDVALVALAAICSVLGIVVGVAAVGEGIRYKELVRGRAAAAVGLVLVVALGAATALRAVDDWYDLDVPAAVDRFELGGEESDLVDSLDSARNATSVDGDRVRSEAVAGQCYAGDVQRPGPPVACDVPHRLEVLAVVEIEYSGPRTPTSERRDAAFDACREAVPAAEDLPEGVALEVLVAADATWLNAEVRSLCLAASGEPRTGTVPR